MYPYPVLFGMTLYELMIALGFVLAVLTYRIHADRRGYPAALQNLTMLGGTFGIGIGYYAAVLVQACYNYLDSGIWDLSRSTGSTFLGGLLGGVIVFFLVLFLGGAIVYRGKENLVLTTLAPNCDIVITCVVIAHACGRLGCLFAGCCHGAIVEGFPGIYNHAVGARTVPIPLFEALFLLLMYTLMTVGLVKSKGHQLVFYLTGYGVWRFIIEYFRTDDRGQTIIPFLSPSQLTSLVMLLIAAAVFLLQRKTVYGKNAKYPPNPTEKIEPDGENRVGNGENSPESPDSDSEDPA